MAVAHSYCYKLLILTDFHMTVCHYSSQLLSECLDAGDVAAPQGGMPFDILSNWVLSHLANIMWMSCMARVVYFVLCLYAYSFCCGHALQKILG